MEMVTLEIDFHLEVAHYMEYFGKGHPNTRLHGHSYTGTVVFSGPVDKDSGMLVDYQACKHKIDELLATYDHGVLNEIPGLEQGSSEQLAKHIYQNVSAHLPHVAAVCISRPTLGMRVRYPGV